MNVRSGTVAMRHTFGLPGFPRLDPAFGLDLETDLARHMDPYALLSDHADLRMEMAPLPRGQRGRWYPDVQVILLSDKLSQAERRCTLMHELVHRTRGDFHVDDDLVRNRVERAVHVVAARLLIPLPALADACLWAESVDEVAETLWVDRETLESRLEHLHPSERGYMRRRLAMKEHTA